ncbi:MAG: NAD(P)-binding domain-containing protein [Planctomycetota bacterium]
MLTQLVVATGLAVVIVVLLAAYLTLRRERQEEEALAEARAAGLNQPVSLHPVIDLEACIGSGACVDVCPESVLGRAGGVTQLIQAAGCIGHGRCQTACPVGAIALVFGTAERGIDLPLLRKNYESNLDGVFVIGELGGMGLIRNAMRQGVAAIELGVPRVLDDPELPRGAAGADLVDVVIVGAGPAGIAAALECKHRKRSFTLLEQFSLGGSVSHYPRRKLVFSEQIRLPLVGKFGKSEMLKEELIAEFERVCLAAGITILEGRRVSSVTGQAGDFTVECATEHGTERHRGRTVVLAIGRRGTPRRLNVPGEELSHVVYRLIDAEQYRHRRVLCVGGGDSSVEAAVSLAATAGTTVHLSYRGDNFYRIKKKNREELEAAVEAGKLRLHLQTTVTRVTAGTVSLVDAAGAERTLEIDDVIVNVGGELPTPFLEAIGVQVETKYGDVVSAPPGASGRFSGGKPRSTRYSKRMSGASPSTGRLPPSTRLRRSGLRRSSRKNRAAEGLDGEARTGEDSERRRLRRSSRRAPETEEVADSLPLAAGEALPPLSAGDSEPFDEGISDDQVSP